MPKDPKLLVVDDETAICQVCQRILSRQGFQVEQCTDASEGLNRAAEGDYAAILLDVKMPEMDGIQFLEELRKKRPDVPVMIMTAYPSVPNAAAAVRLGASDYITKPFTPEQITQSVRRMLARDPRGESRPGHPLTIVESWANPQGQFLFLDESWLQADEDASACVGVLLKCSQEKRPLAVRLPQVGEALFQGLPLAGVTFADESLVVVPSPISGVVDDVNELLASQPSALFTDPCGKGWIACVCTTRFEKEIDRCKPRHVLLANTSPSSAGNQLEQLTSLGCRVDIVKDYDELALAIRDAGHRVLLLDAASFAALGPELVRRVNVAVPSLKVVVIGPSDSHWEAAYREHKIFYYSVEPFVDNEIVEILNAVFQSPARSLRQLERSKASFTPISGIGVTCRHGGTAQLLAAPGLLREGEGLGGQIVQRLMDQALPVRTTRGDEAVTPTSVLKAAGTCDRIIVLLAKDTGRLPGTLVQDTTAEYVSATGVSASKVATLVVQPEPNGHGLTGLDERTIAFLAEHIVQEMASC
ncbi:MAG TPA: response regulator [Thermoguttaceae bacterium]|nr:response regulator [Thermoguttaceae bacterium]